MIKAPECSVIVITYNDSARLPRAVRSALGQSLRNIEVIISDDGSTDGTESVARALRREDRRVRYLRRDVNSGGCGAPRNDGVAAARAPYVMFLDSDDELPPHACKSMLLEMERTGADFVTGQISRLHEWNGRIKPYYPGLFARRRVVEGIAEEPDMFLDSFSTNKIYRTSTLRGLPFLEDLHYEDHVFTTELYCVARRFAVVPWVVYLWHRAAEGDGRPSISLNLQEMDNIGHRIRAARLSDDILRGNGLAGLVADRQRRFVRHDLPVYLNPLPARGPVWAREFTRLVRPYLAGLDPGVMDGADPLVRVCCRLILDEDADELVVAARSLTTPRAAPRFAVRRAGRTYWGTVPKGELDITPLRMAELPYGAARLRHEAAFHGDGPRLALTVRTYDPFGVLATAPDWRAFARFGGHRVELAPRALDDGSYLSEATVDLARAGRGRFGHESFRDPRISIVRADGRATSDRLLVDPAAEPVRVAVPGHEIVAGPEGQSAFLRVRWRRRGALRWLAPRLGRLRAGLVRRLCAPRVKLRVYRTLIRLLPPRENLVLFEADVGAGYTGNPRYVYEELKRRRAPFEMVWSVAGNRRNFPADVRLVRRMSWRYLWTMARAGHWVDSHGLPLAYPKPAGTRYLQTWHGQGVKTVGFDAPDLRADFEAPRRTWRGAVARWDALVMPSAEFERIFVTSNGYRGPVLRHGSPRCDVLVNGDPEAVRRARERLELPGDRKVLLYAPTYRDRAKFSGASVRADLAMMAEELADGWVVVLRTHPVERYAVPERLRHFVRFAGGYPEVNDLMLASDALLTDYSSLMCDYAVTGKPMFFLLDDWEEYRRAERGVNHDLPAIAPGPCVTGTEELIRAIRSLDADPAAFAAEHAARYAGFRATWCAEERGDASARVVDAFFGPVPVPAVRPAAAPEVEEVR
ncbi:CDP-glycerol glycerophosphotransferase family protein [Streptosporangium sp. NPDC020072]|uniref:bifunctional glycosyltransferase/CDP-glycerol:glycerophosphate glycerophosphotransferase n=1 Tax=Streptosporangium sp. NPDC020072 TaxID=3154788 RepID=UPI00342A182E